MQNASIWCSPPPGIPSRWRKAASRRLERGHSASSSSAWMRASAAMSLRAAQPADVGMAAHDARGAVRASSRWRRRAGRPTIGRAAAVARPRARFSAGARARRPRARRRVAVERQHVEVGQLQQVAVLPPGAAQASSTRAPGARPAPTSQVAGAWAAASRTETAPSAKPGRRLRPAPATAQHDGLVSASRGLGLEAGGLPAAAAGAPVNRRTFTRRHIGGRLGGGEGCLANRRGQSARTRSIHHCGWPHCFAGLLQPAQRPPGRRVRGMKRRTALRKDADCGARLRAAVTAWLTRVWSGYGGGAASGHSSADGAFSAAAPRRLGRRARRHEGAHGAWAAPSRRSTRERQRAACRAQRA